MRYLLPLLALIATPLPAIAQEAAPRLSLEHRMLVRCSVAFAMVAHGQASGQVEALRYPDLRESGQEFFVRASAQVMDAAGLDRAQITAALSAEAQDLQDSGTLHDLMPTCLTLLPE